MRFPVEIGKSVKLAPTTSAGFYRPIYSGSRIWAITPASHRYPSPNPRDGIHSIEPRQKNVKRSNADHRPPASPPAPSPHRAPTRIPPSPPPNSSHSVPHGSPQNSKMQSRILYPFSRKSNNGYSWRCHEIAIIDPCPPGAAGCAGQRRAASRP